MPAPYTFSIPLFSLKQQTRSGKFWTAWEACLLREVYFHILMAPFSIGGIQTSGYPGQDSQHPAAKLCSSQWSMGVHQAFFCWLEKKKKKAKLQVTLLHCFVQALVSVFSCAIIRLPCFTLQVLPPLPAGCQLLASTESLKAVHLFGDWQVAQRVKKPINLQQEV